MLNARIMSKHDTTARWNAAVGFIPLPGEIIIYDDYETKEVIINGETVIKTIPNIKIGTGNAYVQDLAFVDSATRDLLLEHIHNLEIHTTLEEKVFWNNKINVDDSQDILSGELSEETLILTRN